MNLSQLYEQDFYAWTVETANQLRSRNLNSLDIDHLLEEVEGMGVSEIAQLGSRLEVLIMHLLKWQYQPSYRGRSWNLTIKEQRIRVKKLLKKMPSLKSKLHDELQETYPIAVIRAEKETGLDRKTFPEILPYTIEQILDDNFYPDNEEK
jgi:hypothetical protein